MYIVPSLLANVSIYFFIQKNKIHYPSVGWFIPRCSRMFHLQIKDKVNKSLLNGPVISKVKYTTSFEITQRKIVLAS